MEFIQDLLTTAALSVLLALLLSKLFSTDRSAGDPRATPIGVAGSEKKRGRVAVKTGEDHARPGGVKQQQDEENGLRRPEEARSSEFAEPSSDDHGRVDPEKSVLDAEEGADTALESQIELTEAKEEGEEEDEEVIILVGEEENGLRKTEEVRTTAESEAEEESEEAEGPERDEVRDGGSFVYGMPEKGGIGMIPEFSKKEERLEEEEENEKGEEGMDVVNRRLEEETSREMPGIVEVERIDAPLDRKEEEEERPEEVVSGDLDQEKEKEEEKRDEVNDLGPEEGPAREMIVEDNILRNVTDLVKEEESFVGAITGKFDLEKENKEVKRFQMNEAGIGNTSIMENAGEIEIRKVNDNLAEEEKEEDEERLAESVHGVDLVAQPPEGALAQKEGFRSETAGQENSGIDGTDEILLDKEDEWEEIERSELEKHFGVANAYIGSGSGADALSRLGSNVQMQFYGLHKVATEGPCYEPQPMALKVSARAKWHAWQRLGNMNPEAAMEQYMNLLSQSIPGWIGEKHRGDIKMLADDDSLKAELPETGSPGLCSSSTNQLNPETNRRSEVSSFNEQDNATTGLKNIELGLTDLDSF